LLKKRLLPCVAGLVLSAALVLSACSGNGGAQPTQTSTGGKDVTIDSGSITETASFIPVQSGSTKMEIIAVKAPDGTIRTALNTCQVCYDSGRGYYVQDGDELVCQNCGNRFKIGQIGNLKKGCNPVPISDGDKSVSGTTITIKSTFLDQNKAYFANWKK
jgi:uncharacterized membrane protein